ncbi:MAG: SusE domain-containing protein [Bacteroidales bacterium]|nr:SusE domain-containing protein [Bacteroidales bacterium]
MKSLMKLIIVLMGFGVIISSCEKENDNPVLNTGENKAPQLSMNFDSLVLSEEYADSTILFEWSPADYNIDDIKDVTYILEMKAVDSSEYMELTSTTETTYSITMGNLNTMLIQQGYPVETNLSFEFRVYSYITKEAQDTYTYSENSNISVSAYAQEIEVKPIYILGDGTPPGWDNNAALEMSHMEDGKFEITVFLDPEAGDFMKFISRLGQWAPQWGTDDSGTPQEGPLVYRPTEDVEDPPAIPIPEEAGDYHVVADTANLTYTTEPATKAMDLINGQTVDMEKVDYGEFTVTTTLNDGTIGFRETGGTNSTWTCTNVQGMSGRVTTDLSKGQTFDFKEGRQYTISVDLGVKTFSIVRD